MPLTPDRAPAGTPCWLDISEPDVPQAVAFYEALLGWDLQDQGPDYAHYHLAKLRDVDAAGLGPIMQEGQPTAWLLYLAADDLEAALQRVRDAGGSVMMEPMDVMSFGRMAIGVDPTGAVFGLWQAIDHTGCGVMAEPGALTWADLRSPDPDRARAFYAQVFGYTYAPVDGAPPDYLTFHLGGEPLGGIGGMMGVDQVPPHWAVYFGVADVDDALATVAARGGAMLAPAFDTPYGRMACVADPAGASFWITATPPTA